MQDLAGMIHSIGGQHQNEQQQQQHNQNSMSGGRRRRGSRTRRGRKGKGGYLMDVAVAAGLLGATQLGKARYGYGATRRRSRRSRRSSRSRSRR